MVGETAIMPRPTFIAPHSINKFNKVLKASPFPVLQAPLLTSHVILWISIACPRFYLI